MSHRRLGSLVDDPDLEARLQRIEAELATKALANVESSTKAIPTKTNISPITGLKIQTNIPGTLTVRWNPVDIINLKYYEVNVANNLAFIHDGGSKFSRTYKVVTSFFEFPDSFDPDATWYVRVRTVNQVGVRSQWTLPISTGTGRVILINEDSESYSLTDPNPRGGIFAGQDTYFQQIKVTQGSNYPDYVGNSDHYGNSNILWKGGTVLPFLILEFDFAVFWYQLGASIAPPSMKVEFWRVHDLTDFDSNGPVLDQNYKVINTINMTFPSTIGWEPDSFGNPSTFRALARQTVSSFGEPEDIATNASFITPGTIIGYRVYIELSVNYVLDSIYFRPSLLHSNMIEVKV